MEDFMDGQMHDWHGGDCPVPEGTMVEAFLRAEGGWNGETHLAEEWEWFHEGNASDIVQFRVVRAAQ